MNSEILTKIEKEEILLNKNLSIESKELEFLDSFLTKNRFNDIYGLLSIDLSELMIAYICSNNDNLSYNEVRDAIYNNENYISYYNIESFDKGMVAILYKVSKNSSLNKINNQVEKLKEKLKNKFTVGAINKIINDIIEDINEKGNNLEKLIELFMKNTDHMSDIMVLVYTIKDMQKELDTINDNIEEISEEIGRKIPERAKDRFSKSGLKEMFNLKGMQEKIKIIEDYYTTETKKRKNKNRKIRKQLEKYKEFKRIYQEEFKKDEITKIDDLIEKIEEKDLRKELLVEIYNHNLPVQQETEKEYNKLSSDYKNKIKLLFDKYKIEYMDNKINNSIELDDLEYELSSLKKIGFKDSNTIINIVNNTNRETIEGINLLVNNNIIPKKFIIDNISLFSKNLKTSSYPILLKNIKALKDKDLNPRWISNNPEVLLIDIDDFSKNLNILEEYNLKHLFKSASSYKFLCNTNLASKIDKILELGYETNLEETLNLLNYDDNSWDVVRIQKMVGENISSIDELLNVLELSNNWLKYNDPNNYIFNFTKYIDNERLISEDTLKEFMETPRTYNFNGVLISKNKIERNLDKNGKVSMKDITRNTTLNEDEYNRIINCFNHKIK